MLLESQAFIKRGKVAPGSSGAAVDESDATAAGLDILCAAGCEGARGTDRGVYGLV